MATPVDKTEGAPTRQDSPALSAFAITPSDSVTLTTLTRAIYVGGSGNLVVVMRNDSAAVTLKLVPAGSILPIRVKQVLSTGTTCSDLVGLT